MLYALIDATGRIVESVDGDPPGEEWVPFEWGSEPDPYTDADSYVIRDGVACYEPTESQLIETERRRSADTISSADLMEALLELASMVASMREGK